ncbi:cytochrome c oxidase subunit 3 [Flavobacteriaceae bacterium F08102]|nr:cytochrome c oxidase subunit 3 [Flavobacteriaceae bacterium F08102]
MKAEVQIRRKASKQMLYISIVSIIMMFAGLTSAYIISSAREDWVSFQMPQALYISTALIFLSSLTYSFGMRSVKKGNTQQSALWIVITLVLGLCFVYFQIQGFGELRAAGLYFAGKESVVSSALLVVISFAHLVHVAAGIIVLLYITIKMLRQKYSTDNSLGVELGGIFWHFVDILWIFLFFFFYFIT